MEGRHRLQDPSAATPAAALAAPDDPLHRPARRLSRPQIRWRAGNPDPVARPPANGRHHRRLSQLPHRLRHAAINRPTARTPPRDPNNRQQTAYSSLSDADLWGKIRTKSDQVWPRGSSWLHEIAVSQPTPTPRTALAACGVRAGVRGQRFGIFAVFEPGNRCLSLLSLLLPEIIS